MKVVTVLVSIVRTNGTIIFIWHGDAVLYSHSRDRHLNDVAEVTVVFFEILLRENDGVIILISNENCKG